MRQKDGKRRKSAFMKDMESKEEKYGMREGRRRTDIKRMREGKKRKNIKKERESLIRYSNEFHT